VGTVLIAADDLSIERGVPVTLLGQQELVEVPPARRLIVPRGHGAWWGVDPGTERVAFACCHTGLGATYTASFETSKGGARLAAIFRETRRVARLLSEQWSWPGLVWVEQPSGDRPNPPLSYATGVIMAAIADLFPHAIVETVPSATWKKAATGYGAHYKPTKKKLGRAPTFEDYGVAVWAQQNGYRGDSWDECDALGIAEAARRTVALEER
jgi:hypothetical protein